MYFIDSIFFAMSKINFLWQTTNDHIHKDYCFSINTTVLWRADDSCRFTEPVRIGSGRFSLPFPASLPQQKEDYTSVEGEGKESGKGRRKGRGKEKGKEREGGRESEGERDGEKEHYKELSSTQKEWLSQWMCGNH